MPSQFIKTPKFLAMRDWDDDFDPTDNDIKQLSANNPTMPPGLRQEETGGTYITISQQGSEREHQNRTGVAQQQETPATP